MAENLAQHRAPNHVLVIALVFRRSGCAGRMAGTPLNAEAMIRGPGRWPYKLRNKKMEPAGGAGDAISAPIMSAMLRQDRQA